MLLRSNVTPPGKHFTDYPHDIPISKLVECKQDGMTLSGDIAGFKIMFGKCSLSDLREDTTKISPGSSSLFCFC